MTNPIALTLTPQQITTIATTLQQHRIGPKHRVLNTRYGWMNCSCGHTEPYNPTNQRQQDAKHQAAAVARALRRPWPGYCQTCSAALTPPDATSCPSCGSDDIDD